MAAATMNIAATVIRPVLAKPLSASSGLRIPVMLSSSSAPINTRSVDRRGTAISVVSTATVSATVNQACHSISNPSEPDWGAI